MQIFKYCEYCSKSFISKTTTTKCCSDNCAKRFYKERKRNEKITAAQTIVENKRVQMANSTIDEIQVAKSKDLLTLIEASLLLNITPLTLRRWILSGKFPSYKIGRKHIIQKKAIAEFLSECLAT